MTDKLDYGQTADFPHFTAAPSGWAPRNFQLARAEAPERADKFLLILALGGAAAETHLSWVVMATAEMTRGCRIFFFYISHQRAQLLRIQFLSIGYRADSLLGPAICISCGN